MSDEENWLVESERRRAEAVLAMRSARRARQLEVWQTVASVVTTLSLIAIAVAIWLIYWENMR
jgi:hypothetical protein